MPRWAGDGTGAGAGSSTLGPSGGAAAVALGAGAALAAAFLWRRQLKAIAADGMGELPRAGGDPDLDVLVEELQALASGAHEARVTTLEAVLAKAQVELAQAKRQLDLATAAPDERRDWAGGLPDEVLGKVASALVAQTEAGWAAHLKRDDPIYWTEERLQEEMAQRKRDGNCLLVFAMVCKGWRKAQLKVGGPLRTRVL